MLAHKAIQQGDTIVEVMLAFAVFSLLAVGSITVMNRAMAIAERALEVTLVRQQIDAQAEALRYVHDTAHNSAATAAEQAAWQDIASSASVVAAQKFGITAGAQCPAIPGTAFIMNARQGARATVAIGSANSAPYSGVTYATSPYDTVSSVSGIWIESVRAGALQQFVDFHIRACWYSATGTPATLGTIVRMYDAP